MGAGIPDGSLLNAKKKEYSSGNDVLSTTKAYKEFFGEIGGQNKTYKNTSFGGQSVIDSLDNNSFKMPGGQAQTFNPQNPFNPSSNLNLKEQIKAGTNVGFYGPGAYDYYVATDEVQNKLQKFVPYGLSKEGAPVVNEAAAQALAEKDLAEGKALELELKNSVESAELKAEWSARLCSRRLARKRPLGLKALILRFF